MRNLYIWFFALILGLNSCSNLQTTIPTSPNVAIVEVTRIVQITTTPIPTGTSTPSPTLKPVDASSTQTAKLIGTPIVADMECYWTATTQSDLNNCAVTRNDEMEKQMATLINAIKGKRYYSEKELQTFLKFQSEWESFTKRECEFRSGYLLDGDSGLLKGGTMAPMNYYECLTQNYQDRLRELQALLYSMSI